MYIHVNLYQQINIIRRNDKEDFLVFVTQLN